MKVASSTSRGYYLIVSDKNKTRLSKYDSVIESDSSEFIEIGKERNHQTAFSTTDLISLNTKWQIGLLLIVDGKKHKTVYI